jgi:hypothetical protein
MSNPGGIAPGYGEALSAFDLEAFTVAGPDADVVTVFEFWLETLRNKSKNRVILSDKRRKKIEKAVKLYGVDDCKKAILGCSLSAFHMGHNGTGMKYDDIELILRDPEHVERFIRIHDENNEF